MFINLRMSLQLQLIKPKFIFKKKPIKRVLTCLEVRVFFKILELS